ncbi:MAG: hypothetical protein IJM18_10550, partial [Clostridia bacterium]|nr:hypothetical protein [Clostridia bacterium]
VLVLHFARDPKHHAYADILGDIAKKLETMPFTAPTAARSICTGSSLNSSFVTIFAFAVFSVSEPMVIRSSH